MFTVARMLAFILIFSACFSLIACNQDELEVKNNISKNVEEYEESANIYEVHVPIIDASKVLKVSEIILPNNLNGMNISCSDIYNESNIIVILYTENPSVAIHEIGMYNFETNNYKKLIDIDEGRDFEICTLDENYMILRFSEDEWRTCQLYYFNFAEMDLINFFSYTVDASNNTVYYQNDNSIVLVDNKVYFDDFYMDSNGNLRVNLYEYIIDEKKLVLLFEDAQNPMIFNEDIVSFRKNDEGKFKDIVSNDNNLIISNSKHLKNIVANKNSFFCIENKDTNHETKTTLFQITDLIKDKPILSTYSPIAHLCSNNRFVSWRNYYDEKPYIYDTDKEQLILFSNINAGVNNFFFLDDLGGLINTKDKENRLFIFTSQ